MDNAKRQVLIERYRQAVEAVFVALDHIPDDDLDVRPEPKAWSARQVVHHLADAELQESIRLRRMLAENTPVLHHWDPQRYAERLHYDRPPHASLELFRASALASIELLSNLSEEQWRRQGNQQRPWNLTVEDWLQDMVTELHNRLMQIINAPHGGRAIPDP